MGELEAPGLKRKQNSDGSFRYYWQARSDLVKRGYRPSSLRLHYPETPEGEAQRAAKCRVLWAEMLAWSAEGDFPAPGFDGTIASLCRLYTTDDVSPYRRLKWNSQRRADQQIKIIVATVGNRQVRNLTGRDFLRWHQNWGAPRSEGQPRRETRAKHCVDTLRAVLKYGATCRYAACMEARTIIGDLRFEAPAARSQKLELAHAEAIIAKAHQLGLHSVALAQALQFECAFRQKDVIGEWVPDQKATGGIIYHGRRWVNGLTWSDIGPDMVLRKTTVKRKVPVAHDLRLCPLAMAEIDRIPSSRRVGPMIVSERTGEPYKWTRFSEAWRRVANAAGVPPDVWNMDSRAGAVSEAYDADADQVEVMKMAGHQDARMSARYNRGELEQTSRAHHKRLQKRSLNKAKGRSRDV